MRDSKRPFTFVICLSVVLLLSGITQAENLKLRVTVEQAKIHLMPEAGSTVMRTFPMGEVLESDKQVGEWSRVILPPDEDGSILTGFVHSSAVEVITKKPVEEKPEKEIPIFKVKPVEEKPVEEKPVKEKPVEEKPVEEKPAAPPPVTIKPPKPTQPTEPQPPPTVLQPTEKPSTGVGLKFYGGMSYVLASDINDELQATTDYWNDRGVEVDGEFDPLNRGMEFGGEFIIHFTPHFGIGLGAGYIQVKSESTVNNIWFGYSYQDTANPKVTAIPLTLSAHLGLPLGQTMNFIAHAGLGYYLGTFSWNYSYDSEFDDFNENWEGKSNALGFHGGLGLEFNFSSKIALVVEGFGRYAKLTGMAGDYTLEETFFGYQGQASIEDATLWYYEWRSSLTEKYYPTIEFDEEEPEEASFIQNIREGEVDLSGFSIRMGIKIRF